MRSAAPNAAERCTRGDSLIDTDNRVIHDGSCPHWQVLEMRSLGLLCRWYELVLAAQDDIATIMTVESGKPLAESKAEFLGGCDTRGHVPRILLAGICSCGGLLLLDPNVWVSRQSSPPCS